MTVEKVELLLAEEQIDCDASIDLLNQFMKWNDEDSRKYITGVFNFRHKKIIKGDQYFSYLINNGNEIFRINAGVKADAYMVQYKLYPDIILHFLKETFHFD